MGHFHFGKIISIFAILVSRLAWLQLLQGLQFKMLTEENRIETTIQQGLVGVTTKGTASKVFAGFPKPVAGKTGSVETGRRATHHLICE